MRKGQKTSAETKLKQSLARMGKSPWNKGLLGYKNKPCTEERKQKISASRLGIVFSEAHIARLREAHLGQSAWNKGKTGVSSHTEETKLKMSESKKGAGSYQYKVDRTQLKKSEKKHLDSRYKEWMLSVKGRDGWKCQISNEDCCGRMEAHHILTWRDHPELRYEIKNGITLCQHHHPRKRAEEIRLSPYFQEIVNNIKL